MKKALIIGALLALIALALGYWQKRRETWDAYPEKIIVDTPEEFQRKNTP